MTASLMGEKRRGREERMIRRGRLVEYVKGKSKWEG
jgi:hypothetical protein